MDLSIHAMEDVQTRTIFEDAEYFSKGYSYKLMPITFEPVNETIIHIEHNYCHWIQSDKSGSNESHNSAMNEEVEERNYKKRKIKSVALDNNSTGKGYETEAGGSAGTLSPGSISGECLSNSKTDGDAGISPQPLDLSFPLPQEQNTDKTLTENQSNIPKIKSDAKSSPDKKQLNLHESNKENVTSPKKIEVTISRPGQKGYYEPCEVFLSDLAKISPDLLKNDCCEIEIIDRTHGQDFQQELSRTYYIVLESTWRIFENSTERIILTNDLDIGQPVQNNERHDKPRYLIFDQYSLTESLAKICESKGGIFEYTCLEEQKEQPKVRDNGKQDSVRSSNDNDSNSLKGDVNFGSESGLPEIRYIDTNTDDGGKEKGPNDRATISGNSNYTETTLLENSDNKVEVDEAKTEQLHPNNSSRDEKFPQISEIPFVSKDGDPTQLENESEICDCNSSTEPAKSVEPNLVLSEPINAWTESNVTDNKCNSGSSSVEGPIELVKEEKFASDIGNINNSSFSQSQLQGTKRVRVSKENSRAISRKINKLSCSMKAENMTGGKRVQKGPGNIDEQETTGEGPDSSFRLTRSRGAQPLRKGEAEKVGKETIKNLTKDPANNEKPLKVAGTREIKGKSRGIKKEISCTDIKTRSSKEVSVLRNGKHRCTPYAEATTATARRERRKAKFGLDSDSAKISKPKPERTGEIKTRERTRKTTSEENRKICLRKRS